MKYIFIFFLFNIILFIFVYRYYPYKIEFFSSPRISEDQLENIENTVVETGTQVANEILAAFEANPIQQTTQLSVDKISQFIIYENRIYAIGIDNKLYCRYIKGGNWFILFSNVKDATGDTTLNDIFVIRYQNNLFIYALYNVNLYRKLVDNYAEDWQPIENLTSLKNIKEFTGNVDNLFINCLKIDDTDTSEAIGVYKLNYNDNPSLEEVNDNLNYISIRTNVYSNENIWYSLYKDTDNEIFAIKNSQDENEDYSDSFEFNIEFIDLFLTSDYVYGYGKDNYIYRKSIAVNLIGGESSSWFKVSSKIQGLVNKTTRKKKLSVYNGYIYCLFNKQIKKHKINGYEWLDINDVEYEKQFYTKDPQKVLNTIHTNLNINSSILPDKLNLYV